MRAGRKRRPGRRYCSGNRVKVAREDDIRRVAFEARMRVFGVSGEIASSHAMGSPLGRLMHWNIITPAQADAGYDFALTMRDYLAVCGGQRPGPNKASFLSSPRGTGACDLWPGTEARARAYMAALRDVDVLEGSSPSVTSIVWDVCISEHDRMGHAEHGLLR